MFRAIWFAVKLGILVAIAVWVANRPGYIEIDWLGYDIRAHIGFVLLVLLIFLLLSLILYRFFLSLFAFSKVWRHYKQQKRRIKGYRALTLGLSAVAAGDAKVASYQAFRMRNLLPEDKGLSLLLEAQAARLKGDNEAARNFFEELMKDKDTAFLGLRGIMLAAIEDGDIEQALSLARKGLSIHPKQPWILRMVYKLELRNHEWVSAEKTLKAARKHKAIGQEQADSDRVALYLFQAGQEQEKGHPGKALSFARKAHRLAPDFSPATVKLTEFYLDAGKKRSAASIVRTAWKNHPHPDLIPLWDKLDVRNKPDGFAFNEVQEKANGKAWHCRETGRLYKHWSPVAEPHGSFNTIRAIEDHTELLITAPSG
jgi:HemY protein